MKIKNKVNKRNLIYWLVFIVILLGLIFNNITSSKKRILQREEAIGTIAFGIYENGKILDSGSDINSKDIIHTLQLKQNLSSPSDYLLMVLIDYKQTLFNINRKNFLSYNFSLENKDQVDLKIDLNIPDGAKELCYLIIKKPGYTITDNDMKKASSLQEIMAIRYNIVNNNNNNNTNIVIEKNTKIINHGPIPDIFLSVNADDLKAEFICDENENMNLVIGNSMNELLKYAVIQLIDWKQVPFQDGNSIKFFELVSNTKIAYNFFVPMVEDDSLVQYIAFPYPFQTTIKNPISTFAFGTFRILVKNKSD